MTNREPKIQARTGTVKLGRYYCVKQLNLGRDLYAEVSRLRHLEDLMGPGIHYDGWLYKSARVIDVFEGERAIWMTRAHGTPLNPAPTYENAYRAGVWLALFHGSSTPPPLFDDYGPGHIFIDQSNRTVTTIDPGGGFGKAASREEDVGYIASSLVLVGLRRGVNPIKLGIALLDGYCSVAPDSLDRNEIMASGAKECAQTRRRWLRKSRRWNRPLYKSLGYCYGVLNSFLVQRITHNLPNKRSTPHS